MAKPKKKLSPIPPGEILLEEFMKPIGLSAHKLALELRVPSNRIIAIASGKRALSAETALRLARYFGTSADFWMTLQARYDLQRAEDELADTIARQVRPRSVVKRTATGSRVGAAAVTARIQGRVQRLPIGADVEDYLRFTRGAG